jgi:hypothetical protein
MKKLKIGITSGLKTKEESIWSNGIKLNVLTLHNLLKKSSKDYDVYLLNNIDIDWFDKPSYLEDVNIFNFSDKFMEMDLIILMGGQVHDSDLKKFKENNNNKVISYKCGNNYINHVEDVLFREERVAQYETQLDEVWYIPQQHENNQGYYHTLYRANTVIVPFLWDKKYLSKAIEGIDNGFIKGSYKKDSKYNPNNDKKMVGVMEPNVNTIKYSLIPSMIVEESYRTEIGKNKINKLMITNSDKLRSNKNFLSIVKTFDLFKDGKISSEGRYQTSYIVSQYFDVVVSHQLMNPLNYLYLDVVYMGYPILHNAYMVKDLGYYYEGSNTIDGSEKLNWILNNHDKNIEEYNQKNKKVLDRYDIENPEMIEIYDKLIYNVFNGGNNNLSYDVMKNRYVNF